MGGDLSFQPSGLFFPRLANQDSFARLLHAIGSRAFNEAHQIISRR
jgi:hypothetical protein